MNIRSFEFAFVIKKLVFRNILISRPTMNILSAKNLKNKVPKVVDFEWFFESYCIQDIFCFGCRTVKWIRGCVAIFLSDVIHNQSFVSAAHFVWAQARATLQSSGMSESAPKIYWAWAQISAHFCAQNHIISNNCGTWNSTILSYLFPICISLSFILLSALNVNFWNTVTRKNMNLAVC